MHHSPRGGLNLYGAAAVERAWGLTHKNAFSNGGIGPEQGGEAFWLRTEPTVAALVSVPADKITEGNPGKRKLTVIEFEDQAADLEGQQMPKPSKLLSATQKDGKPLVAEEVYKATWEWLAERRCASLVSPQLLERYAMCVARWIQCEEAITDYGFLAKHPTTGNAMQSPYVAMSQNFMSQTNRLWMEIYQIVKENCATEYKGETPMDDAMERLLRARKGN